MSDAQRTGPWPFRAEPLRAGDAYELTNGHPVDCGPTSRGRAGRNRLWFSVLDADPAVKSAGVDAGIGREEGREDGRAVRREEGLEGGELDGLRRGSLRVLEGRVPAASERERARIDRCGSGAQRAASIQPAATPLSVQAILEG
jgi:hypothetical protein